MPEETMRALFSILSILILAGCAFIKVNVASEPGEIKERVVEGKGRAKIVVIDVSGIISLAPFGLDRFGKEPAMVPRLKEELQRAMEDERVVGVVVRIDSPGGSVTASDILYHELKSFREKKKVPLLACFVDKGFSGGYYIAMGADELWAHPTSVVGGVGVITFKFDVSDLLDSWGVKIGVVKSGPQKDFWSPLRPAAAEEEAVMQGIVDRLHRRFLGIVQENRQLSSCVLDQIARGGVFDAAPARDLGLIDSVG
jgi:protease-4